MSASTFRGQSRNLAVVAAITALALGTAAWQRSGAIGDEPRKEIDRAAMQHAQALSEAFHNAAEIAMPSVVTVYSKAKPRTAANNRNRRNERTPDRADNPFKGTPLEDWFGERMPEFGQFQMPDVPRREGMGSGVIIDRSGIVLTNNHVVDGADEVVVHLADGREFKAEDIKVDERTDLAVIRFKGDGNLPAARLGDSDKLRVGDWVIAIGNPFNQEQSVSAGIISGMGRDLTTGGMATRHTKYLQTDAAINPGNSGGPLVNLYGEVIGINTAIATTTGSFNGLGFAIPANLAKWVTTQLVDKGSVQRAYLGVQIENVSADMARRLGTRQGEGVLINHVNPNTPASEAGFRERDVIVKFAGQKVNSASELTAIVERTPTDRKQEVEILRDGRPMTLHVTAKPMPKEFGADTQESRPSQPREDSIDYANKDLGLTVANMTSSRAQELGFSDYSGVVVTKVDPNGPAYEYGLREGMLIMKVENKTVKTVEEFHAAVKDRTLKDGIELYVRSQRGGAHFIVIKE